MEKMLLRLARQLDGIDEASLMALWSKYATTVSRFEPTKAWEEAALVFSLIQAKHWKNQLFNYQWARQTKTEDTPSGLPAPFFLLDSPQPSAAPKQRHCRVLAFTKPADETARAKPTTEEEPETTP
ncbi:MAG: hypothetical protein IJU37_11645 [Desulfovibrio sp.]|nr:hypothetical protein [Desulfovibrio sp.]